MADEAGCPANKTDITASEHYGLEEGPESFQDLFKGTESNYWYFFLSSFLLKRKREARWTARYILAIDLHEATKLDNAFWLQERPGW